MNLMCDLVKLSGRESCVSVRTGVAGYKECEKLTKKKFSVAKRD